MAIKKKPAKAKKKIAKRPAAKRTPARAKSAKKKVVRKPVAKKRVVKKSPVKKGASKKRAAIKKIAAPKPIGRTTHFFREIKVAIVRFSKPVKKGTTVRFKGATTDFAQKLESMQYEHKDIATAPKGKQIGIKVKKRVRDGDLVYPEK